MRIKPLHYGLLVLALFWGVIGGAMASNLWVTKQSLPPVGTVTSTEEIKGWMTLEQIGETLSLPTPEVIRRLGLPPESDPNKKLKDLAAEQGKTPDQLKEGLLDHK
ncbi:hypothetical protein HM1_1287 [Heliomicrobium modesticaldum Ice1]|uniref:Uncharacterized protein n=1 Tax=Heliobacterium modesticaldum (strain ATCC 51547 / Ice1) TaxID=498761 RepID=B0TGM9_HELMI|nr:hypothetical protein [Heliomicrobium modesticaldum]ABZ83290.1 hypothetical protein HM1_1287 [Heliomicrobium modesticaldum Ice1]